MKKPRAESKGADSSSGRAALPPPIRLVHAFKQAAESSKPEADPSDEALAVEVLLIAGDASFAALSRLDELFHQAVYGGGGPGDSVDRRVVEDGYHVWLDAATPLIERIAGLEKIGCESESFATFWTAHAEARLFFREAQDRRRLERQALRNDQLATLASRLKPREAADGDRGAGE